MFNTPPLSAVLTWRRAFATECLKRAETLAMLEERTPGQEHELVGAARASLQYLKEVGTPDELCRALLLLQEHHGVVPSAQVRGAA